MGGEQGGEYKNNQSLRLLHREGGWDQKGLRDDKGNPAQRTHTRLATNLWHEKSNKNRVRGLQKIRLDGV